MNQVYCLFCCNPVICGGWDRCKPYLTFDFVLKTHQFNPTPYFRNIQHRKILHNKIMELHNNGWGYTKIHTHLIENGFKIGKSRTTVDSIIRKRIKRDKFLNQSEIIDGFRDFRLEVFES